MINIITEGTHVNCRCPHCDEMNHYVCQDISFPADTIASFDKDCAHCHKKVWYLARREIKVEASTMNPLE